MPALPRAPGAVGGPASPSRATGGDPGNPYLPVHLTGTTSYDTGSGTVAAFTGFEVAARPDGTTAERVGAAVLTAAQPGVFLDAYDPGAVSADAPVLALARLAPGAGGRFWELAPLGGDTGSAKSADDCRGTLRGLTKLDCVEFSVQPGKGRCGNVVAATLAGRWSEDDGAWVSADTFTTAAGDTTAAFRFDEIGNPVLELTAGAVSAVLTPVGCVGGAFEFAAAGCDWCDVPTRPGCGDNTFRVRVACAACAATGCDCPDLPGSVAVRYTYPEDSSDPNGAAKAATSGTYGLTFHAAGDYAWGGAVGPPLGTEASQFGAMYPGTYPGYYGRLRVGAGTLYIAIVATGAGGCFNAGHVAYISDADDAAYQAGLGIEAGDDLSYATGIDIHGGGEVTTGYLPAFTDLSNESYTGWSCVPKFVGRARGTAQNNGGVAPCYPVVVLLEWDEEAIPLDPCAAGDADPDGSEGDGGYTGTVP